MTLQDFNAPISLEKTICRGKKYFNQRSRKSFLLMSSSLSELYFWDAHDLKRKPLRNIEMTCRFRERASDTSFAGPKMKNELHTQPHTHPHAHTRTHTHTHTHTHTRTHLHMTYTVTLDIKWIICQLQKSCLIVDHAKISRFDIFHSKKSCN
jgi:hypothetical protein